MLFQLVCCVVLSVICQLLLDIIIFIHRASKHPIWWDYPRLHNRCLCHYLGHRAGDGHWTPWVGHGAQPGSNHLSLSRVLFSIFNSSQPGPALQHDVTLFSPPPPLLSLPTHSWFLFGIQTMSRTRNVNFQFSWCFSVIVICKLSLGWGSGDVVMLFSEPGNPCTGNEICKLS